jgi:hypothetical protein
MAIISFKLIIGSKDDYPTIDHLLDDDNDGGNKSTFKVDLDSDMKVPFGFKNLEEFAETILHGLAFESSWCDDGIVSVFIVG